MQPNILTISVRENHIAMGDPYQRETNPLLLAVKEQYPKATIFLYGFWLTIILTSQGKLVAFESTTEYHLSQAARRFIRRYECYLPVKPATFRLKKLNEQRIAL